MPVLEVVPTGIEPIS